MFDVFKCMDAGVSSDVESGLISQKDSARGVAWSSGAVSRAQTKQLLFKGPFHGGLAV